MAQKYDFILLSLCAFIIHLAEKNGQYANMHNMLDSWASEGGEGGAKPTWILKLLAKKGCFFNFEG